MKGVRISVVVAAVVFAMAFGFATARAQAEIAQTFDLSLGWNVVFLETQPIPRDPATVFSDLDHLESAWTWLSKETRAEFIQDPSEELYGQPGWLAYFPPGPKGFLTNLYAVLGNQAKPVIH